MQNRFITAVGLMMLTGLFSCSEEPATNSTVTTNGRTIDTSIKMPEAIAPQKAATQVTATPQITPAQSGQATNTAKLNPAHGEPGHDCALPVGAPLNGTKATTPAAATPAAGNARLNPAHGQPGHDCAIPVGAPLKS